ncbi:hypothetical protein AB2B41_23050, partial [Marimonas sp. MJW-29]
TSSCSTWNYIPPNDATGLSRCVIHLAFGWFATDFLLIFFCSLLGSFGSSESFHQMTGKLLSAATHVWLAARQSPLLRCNDRL